MAAFTPDGVYEDVAFGITKKDSAETARSAINRSRVGLYVKLVDSHISDGNDLLSSNRPTRRRCTRLLRRLANGSRKVQAGHSRT